MVKRLGIFVFYDAHGIVDQYIKWLLQDLMTSLTELIVVINGEIGPDGADFFGSIASDVIVRKNEGFDGGAYADVVCNYLGQLGLSKYDEVVFVNDTYYGPFVPFQHIFKAMENESSDFWGLSRLDMGIFSLIDSYMMVFKRRIIESGDLVAFFRGIEGKINDYYEACAYFEIGLLSHFKDLGYQFSTYMKPRTFNIFYEILMEDNLDFSSRSDPVLKRKAFSNGFLSDDQCIFLLWRISAHSVYDIDLITENVARIYNRHFDMKYLNNAVEMPEDPYFDTCNVSHSELAGFLAANDDIYIYGTGLFGRLVYLLMKDAMKNLRGFVVSDGRAKQDRCYGYPVKYFSELERAEVGILVSLSAKSSEMIKPDLCGWNALYLFSSRGSA